MNVKSEEDKLAEKREGFLVACERGDVNLARKLIFTEPKVLSTVDEGGRDALSNAVRSGDAAMTLLNYLFSSSVNFLCDSRDHEGRTALHHAAGSTKSATEVLAKLVQQGLSIQSQDKQGRSPLHTAIQAGNVTNVRFIVEQLSGDIEARDKEGETALHYTITSPGLSFVQRIQLAKYLVDTNKTSLQAVDNYGYTVVHHAADKGELDLLSFALKNGAEVGPSDIHGRTPLHVASIRGKYEVVKRLIAHSAEVNAVDKEGHTPLHYAQQGNFEDVSVQLLFHGATHSSVDEFQPRPTHMDSGLVASQTASTTQSGYPTSVSDSSDVLRKLTIRKTCQSSYQ